MNLQTVLSWLSWFVVGFAILFLLVLFPYLLHLKSRAIAAGGPLLLKLTSPRARRWRLAWDMLVVVLLIYFICLVFTGHITLKEVLSHPLYLLPLLLPIFRIASHLGLDTTPLEIREHGIVTAVAFRPWHHVQSYQWDNTKPNTLKIKLARYGFVWFRITPEKKEAVETLLQQHLQTAFDDNSESR